VTSIYDRLLTLSTPARVRLLRLLELEELTVGEVARVVQMPQSTVSRHLKELYDHGWVDRRREGTATLFARRGDLDPEAVALWELVQGGTDGDHPEDGLRLAAVLAARETDSRAFFGRVAGNWAEVRRELFGEGYLLPSLLALLPRQWTVVDLGCGPGDALAHLAPWVARAIGVDREPVMLDAARQRLSGLGDVELREGTLERPPLADGEVDAALLMLVLPYVEDPAVVVRAAAKALRPGGHVVLVDMVEHDREEYRRSMGHRHLGFSDREVVRLLEGAGLTPARYVRLVPDPAATGPGLFVAVGTR
jgi:SAM-dependent methyltransferase